MTSDVYCCVDGFMYDPATNSCDVNVCPCEGCCDFNCCDEVDYFMHRMWYETYSLSGHYADYEDFYN